MGMPRRTWRGTGGASARVGGTMPPGREPARSHGGGPGQLEPAVGWEWPEMGRTGLAGARKCPKEPPGPTAATVDASTCGLAVGSRAPSGKTNNRVRREQCIEDLSTRFAVRDQLLVGYPRGTNIVGRLTEPGRL